MAASKQRLLWRQLPAKICEAIEQIAGATVVGAQNCPGGFSAGLASRLRLANGDRAFAKAVNGGEWPVEAEFHRGEARTVAALPPTVLAPRFRGSFDDGDWIALVFDDVAGVEPAQPWMPAEFGRVIDAMGGLSAMRAPAELPRDHPLLGGWADIAADTVRLSRLPAVSAWAAERLDQLVALEIEGVAVAQGNALVHFDAYPHNIVLTSDRVYFVDWAHARIGAPYLDLLILCTAPAGGIDPETVISQHPVTAKLSPRTINGVLAALAGHHLAIGLLDVPPAMQPIMDTRIALGRSTLHWLAQRVR